MEKAFRDIADLFCRSTGFALTMLFVVVWAFVLTLTFGPSREVALSVLCLGFMAAFTEFRNRPS